VIRIWEGRSPLHLWIRHETEEERNSWRADAAAYLAPTPLAQSKSTGWRHGRHERTGRWTAPPQLQRLTSTSASSVTDRAVCIAVTVDDHATSRSTTQICAGQRATTARQSDWRGRPARLSAHPAQRLSAASFERRLRVLQPRSHHIH